MKWSSGKTEAKGFFIVKELVPMSIKTLPFIGERDTVLLNDKTDGSITSCITGPKNVVKSGQFLSIVFYLYRPISQYHKLASGGFTICIAI